MATKMTIQQLKEQMEAAKRAFEEAAKAERDTVLPELIEKIKLYGFTAEDLQIPAPKAVKTAGLTSSVPTGTTLELNGQKWTKKGGRGAGAPPSWVRDFLSGGGDWNTIVAKN